VPDDQIEEEYGVEEAHPKHPKKHGRRRHLIPRLEDEEMELIAENMGAKKQERRRRLIRETAKEEQPVEEEPLVEEVETFKKDDQMEGVVKDEEVKEGGYYIKRERQSAGYDYRDEYDEE